MDAMAAKVIVDVSHSRDPVTRFFKPLFDKASIPIPEVLARARFRCEVGNPPGDKGDPLGDQLSWEQLLGIVEPGQSIWIITNDSDYWFKYKNNVILNPFLRSELEERNGGANIWLFTKLGDGLTDFSRKNDIGKDKIPAEYVLEEIREAEERVAMPKELHGKPWAEQGKNSPEQTVEVIRHVISNRLYALRQLSTTIHFPPSISFRTRGYFKRAYFLPQSELPGIIAKFLSTEPVCREIIQENWEIEQQLLRRPIADRDMNEHISRKMEAAERARPRLQAEVISVLEGLLDDLGRIDPETQRFR